MKLWLTILSMAALGLPAAANAEDKLLTSVDGTVVFRGSYGITAIEANELVYSGKQKISQLIWQSTAVSTFTGQVKVDFDRFFLRATGTMGLDGKCPGHAGCSAANTNGDSCSMRFSCAWRQGAGALGEGPRLSHASACCLRRASSR